MTLFKEGAQLDIFPWVLKSEVSAFFDHSAMQGRDHGY